MTVTGLGRVGTKRTSFVIQRTPWLLVTDNKLSKHEKPWKSEKRYNTISTCLSVEDARSSAMSCVAPATIMGLLMVEEKHALHRLDDTFAINFRSWTIETKALGTSLMTVTPI